ncbi:hypothetical protein BKH42_03715 [Helicobacter sp. 13S00482-2]|uniref:hypothetical protein n=1 Tax=Helicobacter sp. 13S00482-2 TaxID=1476200 RepID=UPI000BA5DEF3|nr:hypothetical protein [Helicobacter sp. 13S00482-2]PAF53849.1 hypothetical protein BKH42_03715 [Helicobacter sp. 13S00482-2]
MVCKFCPKIKRFDIFFIIIVCLAVYGVDKYQSYKKEKEHIREFEKLQKDCLFGDNKACKKVYGK